ncbi:SAM-dependent methyltransferase [Nocardia crassostreae]|uniref:SAM-dependent methyltransferase n=1 Tax=Nocardia crassostreae TaxID=53428 RepID=UPI000837250A|nr:class I SAM-dependent methyltransferase [Nocardia crassostreae]
MASDARFDWLVTTMAVRPADRILEIGAGSGPSVAYLAAPLRTGSVTAVDRSATAIARSTKRHAALIDSGRLRLFPIALEALRPEDVLNTAVPAFDKVLAVNVNLFWTRGPATELALIRRLLAPGGALFLAYGYGDPDGADTSPKPVPDTVSGYLEAAGYDVRVVSSGDLLCVIATPGAG